MVAPAAAGTAVILPALAKGARSAQASITEALTADLVVLRGTTQYRRKTKRRPSGDVDWEFHLNPAALGVAAVGAATTLWLLQLRAQPTVVADEPYGYWYAVGLNQRMSADMPERLRGTAPQYYVPPESGGPAWEYATWQSVGMKGGSTKLGVTRRQGFFGAYSGSNDGNLSWDDTVLLFKFAPWLNPKNW